MCEEPDICADRPVDHTRRGLLVAAALGASSLAGCLDGSGSTTDGGAGTTVSPGTEPQTTAPPTTAQELGADEPVTPVPSDASCAVCNMAPADYPDWNAQLAHESGDRAYFCSPGCLVAYAATPSTFTDVSAAVASVWVHDHATGDLVDGTDASYVLELNADHIDAPMMRNPVPFGSAEDALAYVGQYDALTREDVVSLPAFDLALARAFRARLLPETDAVSSIEAATVPGDATCGVCEMAPANFPDWNAQLSFETADRTFFCSPGCMAAFYADPGHFVDDLAAEDVVGAWVHDHATGDLVDGTHAWYVLETNADRIDAPMMRNPVPFAARADALDYVGQYDDLGEADVVALDGFTREVAVQFRERFL